MMTARFTPTAELETPQPLPALTVLPSPVTRVDSVGVDSGQAAASTINSPTINSPRRLTRPAHPPAPGAGRATRRSHRH